jgi:hypothetical protein
MKTPVALFIFNRPDTTLQVFRAIQQAEPETLLVIADGPRLDRIGEAEKCQSTRAIIDQMNWKCQVLTNFSDHNLGCRPRISSGLDWIFQTVDEAIILEDDCVPDPTFFPYCEELLERYRHDTRIMAISGNNFQFGNQRTNYSYYFSRYNHIWGWATWRRVWQNCDPKMQLWPEIRDGGWLQDILSDPEVIDFWSRIFQGTYVGALPWSFAWTFSAWINNGLTVLPNQNLVSNIGFGLDATHAKTVNQLANLPVEPISFPLRHPPFIMRDCQADSFTEDMIFSRGILRISK